MLPFSSSSHSLSDNAIWLQGGKGDYVSLDLGYLGCRAQVTSLQIALPIGLDGTSCNLSADASGAALQPAPASADWQNLLVTNLHPRIPDTLACAADNRTLCGILNYTFPIRPFPASLLAAPTASGLIPNVTVNIEEQRTVQIDVSTLWTTYSRTYRPDIQINLLDSTTAAAPESAGVLLAPQRAQPADSAPSGSAPSVQLFLHAQPPVNGTEYTTAPGRRLLRAGAVLPPLPSWLYTSLQVVPLMAGTDQLTAKQLITISRAAPASAVGTYTVRVAATDLGNHMKTAVAFRLTMVSQAVRQGIAAAGASTSSIFCG